jgi:hypothetical protein
MAQTIAERWMMDALIEANHEINQRINVPQNNRVEDSTKEVCYIKRTGGEWQQASPHHYAAYKEYLNTINKQHGQMIEVPHPLGGDFVAWFFETEVRGMFKYDDEFGRNTHIRMFSEL